MKSACYRLPLRLAILLWEGLLLLLPLGSLAQTKLVHGLRGAYYDGLNFDYFIEERNDPTIDFNWPRQQPINGVPPEYFTVRWTGWLVPPVSGRYVLHLNADDGVRLWLDGKLVLDEWRAQSLTFFEVPVQLQAGHSYALRLDFSQYILLAHVQLSWELPQTPEVLHSWRTLWGLTEAPIIGGKHQEGIIPARYLFSRPVSQPPVAEVVVKVPAPKAILPPKAPTRHVTAKSSIPQQVPRKLEPLVAQVLSPTLPAVSKPPVRLLPEPLAENLVSGQSVTLRALYFEQSKANLPVLAQASLDTLAQVLRRYPNLRLEVQGHTDNQGDSTLNRRLSLQRAEAVCRYLISHGVAASRLRPVGLGGTQPVADNSLPAQRPRNRRVVLRPLP